MTRSNTKAPTSCRPLSLLVPLLLSACGGGGGGSTSSAQDALPQSASVTVTAVTEPAINTDSEAILAAAVALSVAGADSPAAATSSSAPTVSSLMASDTSDVPTGASPTMLAAAISLTPVATPTKTYYVDDKAGNDANNGLSAVAGASGNGPWRTLKRLATFSFAPGDNIRLACGGVWNETLKLNSSGTATQPLVVTAQQTNCTVPPSIDGSVSIAPAQWTKYQGNIYRAPLAGTALALASTAGLLLPAHHPNRGFDATVPNSLYLRNAQKSNSVAMTWGSASTFLTTGTDLKLPAGASLSPGTPIRIRSVAFSLDDVKVASVSGSRITFDKPSTYAIDTGWGYFFTGRLWMLDSPGEWYHDAANSMLYAWMPDSAAPSLAVAATQLATGVDLQSQAYISIDRIAVRNVGLGVNLRQSTGVTLSSSRIEDTAGLGVDAAASLNTAVINCDFNRTGNDAISGTDKGTAISSGLQVVNSRIGQSGVLMNGDTVISLPVNSTAAIRAGTKATITGNTIIDAGYIGIWVLAQSTVRDNYIRGACSVLDDCGAIYTYGIGNASVIANNVIERSRGAVEGKAPQSAYAQAQGIYVDEAGSLVTVDGNTVLDTDYGIHVHNATSNIIQNNKLYGNRHAQIWLQETTNKQRSSGDLYGNRILNNQIVPTSPSARGFESKSEILSTEQFATFNGNRYFDRVYATIGKEANPTLTTDYTMAAWKSALSASGTPRGLDAAGHSASEQLFATALISGTNIVPNGKLATDIKGWSSWNATVPYGKLTRQACPQGWCAGYVAGASEGLVSTPNFSVKQGQWYRLSVDIAAGTDGQALSATVRRGGGGSNGYESLGSGVVQLTPGTAWKRFSFTFQATKTVNANDAVTGDLGARIDFQQIKPGLRVSVGNVEIVPITTGTALTQVDLLLNKTANAMSMACPAAATNPAACAMYARLSDNAPVTWPYALGARSSEIIYTLDKRLTDADGDGIPDSQDACPGTPAGNAVGADGCSYDQRR